MDSERWRFFALKFTCNLAKEEALGITTAFFASK
jgi:hypothetical protein